MSHRHRLFLIVLIVLYMLCVRAAFGWLAGRIPFTAHFPHSVASALPWVVAVLCVVGLAFRNAWAWWLTLAALLYEIVTFGQGLPRFFSLTAYGAIGMFKLLYLLAMAGLLLLVRR